MRLLACACYNTLNHIASLKRVKGICIINAVLAEIHIFLDYKKKIIQNVFKNLDVRLKPCYFFCILFNVTIKVSVAFGGMSGLHPRLP